MKTLYIGNSLKEFNCIRDVLDKNKIKYKFTQTSHEQDFLAPGRGSVRSFGANFSHSAPVYEIIVKEQDYDNAQYQVRDVK